jgi:hypothetical protein
MGHLLRCTGMRSGKAVTADDTWTKPPAGQRTYLALRWLPVTAVMNGPEPALEVIGQANGRPYLIRPAKWNDGHGKVRKRGGRGDLAWTGTERRSPRPSFLEHGPRYPPRNPPTRLGADGKSAPPETPASPSVREARLSPLHGRRRGQLYSSRRSNHGKCPSGIAREDRANRVGRSARSAPSDRRFIRCSRRWRAMVATGRLFLARIPEFGRANCTPNGTR